MKVLTNEDRDVMMAEAEAKGWDFHRLCAAAMYEVDYEDVTKEQRGQSKRQNFLYFYGGKMNATDRKSMPPQEAFNDLAREWNDLEFRRDDQDTRSAMESIGNQMKQLMDTCSDLVPAELKTYAPVMADLAFSFEDHNSLRARYKQLGIDYAVLEKKLLAQTAANSVQCVKIRGSTRWLYQCRSTDRPFGHTKFLNSGLDECPDCKGVIEEVGDSTRPEAEGSMWMYRCHKGYIPPGVNMWLTHPLDECSECRRLIEEAADTNRPQPSD